MDIMHLRHFQVAAQKENLTRAAEALHISQPALSVSLSKLEKELGVQLFDRVGRRIQLNSFGKIYIDYVEEALQSLDTGARELGSAAMTEKQRISLCAVSLQMVQGLLSDFQVAFPNIVMRRYEIMPRDVQSELASNECDIVVNALCGNPVNKPGCRIIKRERLFAAVYKEHPLAGRKEICLADLKDAGFISLPEGYSFREITEELCHKADFQCDILMECFHCQLLNRVSDRIGISLATEDTVLHEQARGNLTSNLVFLPLTDEDAYRNIVVQWNEDRVMPSTVKKFINFATTYYTGETYL